MGGLDVLRDERASVPNGSAGRVGEWLKPADCKSAAPCGLRRFESSPVHQFLVAGAAVKDFQDTEVARNVVYGKPESAWVAQLVERVLGKDEVTGSIPVNGSRFFRPARNTWRRKNSIEVSRM